jgi:hypothetical protein
MIENYLITRGYKKEQRKYNWNLIDSFPNISENDIEKATRLFNILLDMPDMPQWYGVCHEGRETIKKFFYKEGQEITSVKFNLNDDRDIIMAADFLGQNPEIIAVVDFFEIINERNQKIDVFDGDVFSTRDDLSSFDKKDGDLYLCTNRVYKKLLYTKGKGFLRNGQPDIDDDDCNHYAATLRDSFIKIGNIYADASFLVESGER